jgi:hypothetical protein
MSMAWIAGANGTGSSASITLSSIPQTYTHLQLRGIVRSAGVGSQIYTRFNNDGGSNYSTHYLYGDGSGVAAGSGGSPTTVNFFGSMPASTDLANAYASFVIDILDYTNTNKYTTTKNISGLDVNGSGGFAFFSSSVWMNTAAVTSLTFVANASFTTATRIDLYGIATSQITGA